jgi:hypothetical protein
MKHHAIVICSWNPDVLKEIHKRIKAIRVMDEGEKREIPVSDTVPALINSYSSFLVAPDGSKEGWVLSDLLDGVREKIKAILDEYKYKDNSTPVDWVEISFGEDDYVEPEITSHSVIQPITD